MASIYRKEIFSMMDKEFEIDWFFGEPISDIKTFDIGLLKRAINLNTIYGPIPGAYRLKGLLREAKRYDTIIMTGDPSLLSSWYILLYNFIGGKKRKIYLWTHGWYGREGLIKKLIKKIYFALSSGVLVYGDYARNLMIKEGINPQKLWPIHNSLAYSEQIEVRKSLEQNDVYSTHFNNTNRTIIFIGRLKEAKRLDILLNAVANLRSKGENYNVVFVGDGDMRGELETLASALNLTEVVWFYGACYDDKRNAELIYNADLCVSPGNVGLTAVHAMMFGTPVATHSDFSHQMPEFETIEEGSTGFFFKENDIDDLSGKISEWFKSSSDSRDAIRQRCYDEIDKSWNPEFQISVLRKILN